MGGWNKPTVQGSLSSNVFPVVSGAAPGGLSWYKHEAFQEYPLRFSRVAKVFTEPSFCPASMALLLGAGEGGQVKRR